MPRLSRSVIEPFRYRRTGSSARSVRSPSKPATLTCFGCREGGDAGNAEAHDGYVDVDLLLDIRIGDLGRVGGRQG